MTSNAIETSSADQKACGFSKLSNGKRHLRVGDDPEAVSTLALACELLAKQFGETNIECGEAYFYYGKALLEMARLENGVLGHALDGVPDGTDFNDDSQVENPEKMTDEEKNIVEAKVKEALAYNYETCEVEKNKAEAAEMEEDHEEDDGEEVMGEESMIEPAAVHSESMETTDYSTLEGNDEKEASNLEQAWEMLELAKVLFTKEAETTTDMKKADASKRICDIYLHLGEISLENENFEQAVEDLTTCLAKRKEVLPADSRSIAETHYQLGIAQAYRGNFTEAECSLCCAISVLSSRLENLKKMETSEFLEKEIVDLQELVKEVEDTKADIKEMKSQPSKKLKESLGGSSISGEMPVSSIAVKKSATAAAAM